jgi:uncharacterized protein YecT (DUF1311 family)
VKQERELTAIVTRIILILGAGLMATAPARADAWVEPEARCDGNTLQIVDCLIDRAAQWEKRMDAAYQQAVKDALPEQREKLLTAQRLWLQYRDANCEYYGRGPGTWASIQAGYCMKDLTATRAQELESATERH